MKCYAMAHLLAWISISKENHTSFSETAENPVEIEVEEVWIFLKKRIKVVGRCAEGF